MNEQRDPIYAVINVGSFYLSGMLARKSSAGRVIPLSAHRLPTQGCVRHGAIHNIEEAAQIISTLLDALSERLPEEATISGVYVGLECRSMHSEHYIASKDLGPEGSVVTPEDLETLRDQVKDAHYPGMSILSVTAPLYLCDGQREANPRGVRCSRLEAQYLLVVARQNIIVNLRETFVTRLGLQILGILPTPLVEAAAALSMEEMALGAAYVNIGGGTTSVTIYQNRFPVALYVLPLGGNNVTHDLTQLSTPLLESDAERLKITSGSMDLSVSRTQEIHATSSTGGAMKIFSQIEVNRFISARVIEILGNVVSIIEEAGFTDYIPKGFVFAGGVTRTRYFYETLRKLSPQYREAALRRDIYEEQTDSSILTDYLTEISLLYQAQEAGVTFQERPMDNLFHDEIEPMRPAAEPTPSAATEEDEHTYIYSSPQQDEHEGDYDEEDELPADDGYEDEYDDPEPEPKKKEKSIGIAARFRNLYNSILGTTDEEQNHE